MSRLLPVVASMSVLALLGCGDNTEICDPVRPLRETWNIDGCPAALRFASRDTAGLLAPQPEVDRYLDRWRRVIAAEPILAGRIPQQYWSYGGTFSVYTTNPQLIDVWGQRVVETGDVELDGMLSAIGATLIAPARDLGPAHRASFQATHAFNGEFLAAAMATRLAWMDAPVVHPSDDGTWEWLDTSERAGRDDATAKIDFALGWGDCLSGCGLRELQAIVPPNGAVTVYDLGGASLPPGLSLSPNTKPRP